MPIPDVSVVMGVYNAAAALPATLRSVLGQEGCSLEFIVIDDGSTDETPAVLARFAREDSRLRVSRQENAGLTSALVAGCAQAQAPFIARQDAGDVSLPGRLANELGALRANDRLAFVSCSTRYVEAGGGLLYAHQGSGRARTAMDVIGDGSTSGLLDGPSHHGAVMFRSAAYRAAGGYRPEFYYGQDWDLWYRLAQHGLFLMLDETLYVATVGVNDISTTQKAAQEALARLSLQSFHLRRRGSDDAEVLAQARAIRPRKGQKRTPRQVADAAYFIGECLRRNGDFRRARGYFSQALRERPLHAKSWLRLAQIGLERQG